MSDLGFFFIHPIRMLDLLFLYYFERYSVHYPLKDKQLTKQIIYGQGT